MTISSLSVKRYICESWNIFVSKKVLIEIDPTLAIFAVQNYGDRIMQILTTRFNLEFRKLTLYGISRPQSIRKSKQISAQTSSTLILRKNATFAWLKIA